MSVMGKDTSALYLATEKVMSTYLHSWTSELLILHKEAHTTHCCLQDIGPLLLSVSLSFKNGNAVNTSKIGEGGLEILKKQRES